jgi:hypothetical protein
MKLKDSHVGINPIIQDWHRVTDMQLGASFGIERNLTSYIVESSLIDHTMYHHEPNTLILENTWTHMNDIIKEILWPHNL